MSRGMSRGICSMDDCERPHYGRGYCKKHYGNVIKGQVPRREREQQATTARLEDLHFMAEHGESLIGAAHRLGISERALEMWLKRQGAEALTADLRSRNPRDPNALANRTAVFVDPRQVRYLENKRKKAIA
jgi:hypothetical protein